MYCRHYDFHSHARDACRRIQSNQRWTRLRVRLKKVRVSFCDPCVVPPIQPSWISHGICENRLNRYQESNHSKRTCRVRAVYPLEMLAISHPPKRPLKGHRRSLPTTVSPSKRIGLRSDLRKEMIDAQALKILAITLALALVLALSLAQKTRSIQAIDHR